MKIKCVVSINFFHYFLLHIIKALAVLITDVTIAKRCVINEENCKSAFARCGLWPPCRTDAEITTFLARKEVASQLVVNETSLAGVLFRGVDVKDPGAVARALTAVRHPSLKRTPTDTLRAMQLYGVSPPQPLTFTDYSARPERDAASWVPTGMLDPLQRMLFKPNPADRSVPSRNLDVFAMTLTPDGRQQGLNPKARNLDAFFLHLASTEAAKAIAHRVNADAEAEAAATPATKPPHGSCFVCGKTMGFCKDCIDSLGDDQTRMAALDHATAVSQGCNGFSGPEHARTGWFVLK
jgi:hypothetical protein